MKLILSLCVLAFCITSTFAGGNNYVTITVPGVQGTNATYQISQGQAAEIVGIGQPPNSGSGPVYENIAVQINGQTFNVASGAFVAGPATFTLQPIVQNNSGVNVFFPNFMTLNIVPSTFDVQKTLILPPGPGQFYVSLQTSTDLINWSTATNGIYGSPNTAQFFRISMTSTNSP